MTLSLVLCREALRSLYSHSWLSVNRLESPLFPRPEAERPVRDPFDWPPTGLEIFNTSISMDFWHNVSHVPHCGSKKSNLLLCPELQHGVDDQEMRVCAGLGLLSR